MITKSIKKAIAGIKLKDFLVPAVLDNTNEQGIIKADYQTKDWVYIRSFNDLKNLTDQQRLTVPTDYAILRGVCSGNVSTDNRKYCSVMTRTCKAMGYGNQYVIGTNGSMELSNRLNMYPNSKVSNTVAPCIRLDCDKVIKAKEQLGLFNVKLCKDTQNVMRHTLQFGSFPQTYVGDKLNDTLSQLKNAKKLKPTGKKYICNQPYIRQKKCLDYSTEYEYNGEKYVLMHSTIYAFGNVLKDGTIISINNQNPNQEFWVKVQPIEWEILNWEDMPVYINPYGTGKAKYIELVSRESLLSGIYIYDYYQNDNVYLWQNSIVRQALNGFDILSEIKKGNGNKSCYVKQNFHCQNQGFVNEAFEDKVLVDFDKEISKVTPQVQPLVDTPQVEKKELSTAEKMRNELIKKALERRKQVQQSNNSNDQNENVL